MPNIKTKDGIEISGVPQEILDNPILGKQMVESLRSSSGAGTYNYADVAQGQAMPPKAGTSLVGTPEQRAQITPAEDAGPQTTVKGIADAFIKEAGPMAAITGLGLLGGATGATVLGLGAKGAEFLNETIYKDLDVKIANPLEAGRKFLEKIGVTEDPDTVWERIAQKAGVGVDEAITSILLGNALSGAAPLLSKIPKIGEKVGQAASWVGNLLKSKPGSQIVGGAGGGGGAQGGAEFAEYAELGPVMSTVTTLAGGVLGDLTTSQLANIAGKVQDLARATGRSVPEAAQEIINRAKTEGVDVLLSDIKPLDQVTDIKRNVREVIPGGTGSVRFNTQAPQRRRIVENLANEYGVDIDSPELNKHLEGIATDFFAKRDEELSTLTRARDEVIENLSASGDAVPTPTANSLIDEKLADLQRIDNPQNNPIEKALENWKERFSDLPDSEADKTLATIEELRADLSQAFTGIEGGPRNRGQKIADELYSALRKDMDTYIKNADPTGMEFKKFDDAMSGLSTLMDDFSTEGISQLMNNRATPIRAIENIIINGKPDVIEQLYKKLSPEGQSNARAAVIAKFIEDASSGGQLTARGMEANISPNKIAANIKKYGGQHGVLFSAEDSEHLTSIGKIFESTSRAEKDALIREVFPGESVPGVKYGIARLISQNPVVGIPAALSWGPFTGAMARFMEQPALRDLMLKYDDLPTRARSGLQGDELLKRMGEVIKGYLETEETEESDAAMERINTAYPQDSDLVK